MNNMTHITALTPRTHDDAPGGGYLDDAALLTVLDHELQADKHFSRATATHARAVASSAGD
jgi:uncharacterized membrane protein YkvA (DUF1232 family)